MLARVSGVVLVLNDVTGALVQVDVLSMLRPQSFETSHQNENNELINTASNLCDPMPPDQHVVTRVMLIQPLLTKA